MRRAFLVFVAFTAIVTWPQVARLDSIPDHEDAYFSLWRLAWIAHALVSDPRHLFDGNIFHPERYTLAYSDATLLEALIGLPFILAGVPVVYVYNALVLGSFVACGLAMYLLALRLTRSPAAALLAGAVFAFAPFRFDHYFHLELLWSPWLPLACWFAHRTIEGGRIRDGIGVGVSVGFQVLSSIYYGVFLATMLVALAAVLLAGRITRLRRRAAVSLACGAVVTAALALPYMAPYWRARQIVGERNTGEASLFAAGPRHYLSSTPDNVAWGRLTGGWGRHEKRLFPGLTALCLTVLALWPPFTRTTAAYAVVLVLAIDLSFGPRGLGYEWLRDHVAVYRGIRAPARMGQLALLAFAALAALGCVRLQRWLTSRGRPVEVISAVLVAVAFAECLVFPRELKRVAVSPPPVYEWLRDQPGAVVAELPMPTRRTAPLHEAEFQFLSTFHWHPLVNGYSGNWSRRHVGFLDRMEAFPGDDSLQALRSAGVTHVLLHERYYDAARYRELAERLRITPDIRPLGRFDDGRFEVAVYRVAARTDGGSP